MTQSILSQLINNLTKTELISFEKRIRVLYQDKRADIPALFQLIKKSISSNRKITKEVAWSNIYQNVEFNQVQFRKTMSILKAELETYLVFEDIRNEKVAFELQLARNLRRRNARELFRKQVNKIERGLSQQKLDTSDAFYYRYQLASEKYEFDSRETRGKIDYLEEMMGDLKRFFLLETLRRSCHLLSHQSISARQYDITFLNEALQFADQSDEDENPAFKIYYLIYQSYDETENTGAFDQLKIAIEKHWQTFSENEIRDIYLFSINICIRYLNRGSKRFLREALELYQSAIEKEIIYENGMISPFTYKNIVSIALALEERKWAFDFLHEQKQHLDPDNRENTFAANLATYYYKIGELDKAMELLQNISFKDVYDNLTYRALLMRIYYQLKEYSALEHHLESFASYLYRHKDLGYHKDLYKNLIRIMRKIIRSNLREVSVKERIIHEIEASQQLAEKSWLLNTIKAPY